MPFLYSKKLTTAPVNAVLFDIFACLLHMQRILYS